jgi:hypothetical protein
MNQVNILTARFKKATNFLWNNKGALRLISILFIVIVSLSTFLLIQNSQDIRKHAFAANFVAPDLRYFAWTTGENRFDTNGDGTFDSYWSGGVTTNGCTISLFDITTHAKKWDATLPNCSGLPFHPIFHSKSFIGDSTRDFTIVIAGPNFATNDRDYHLIAGDGQSGQLRNFDLFLGNANRAAVVRVDGVQVVDFKLPLYPGPALFVRTTSDGYQGHLYYFPQGSTSFTEITGSMWGSPAFPGVDLPQYGYTNAYNTFNFDLLKCSPITDASADPQQCGVPDTNNGDGLFLDQAMVGDIDADGVDDVVTTYFWKYATYPGKPKGQTQYVGAAQYEVWYNPQNDNTACHSGRHYGINELVDVAGDPYPEQVDLAGSTVNNFNDIYQNVSRNVALIKTSPHPTIPTLIRSVAWNIPMGTSIPDCGANNTNGNSKLYDNSLHYPATGVIKDENNKAKYIQYNRFTQTNTNQPCVHTDVACHNQLLSQLTGTWTWELLNITNGSVAKRFSNMYVWDTIPNNATSMWVIYSSNANIWNLGDKSITGIQQYRDDITIALLDLTSLTLSNQQVMSGNYNPYLRTQQPQNIDTSLASIWKLNRLFTIPVSGSQYPGFVLKSPNGLTLMAYNGINWEAAAEYSATGALITTTPALSCPSTGLTAFWNLNDTGTNIVSQVGMYNGTATGTTSVNGKLENGRQFNGTNEFVSFGNIMNFEKNSPFSISAWVNQTAGTDGRFILSKQDNYVDGGGYYLSTDNSGNVVFGFGPTQSTMIAIGANQDIRGGWHHIVVTYDGSGKGAGLKLFIDGVVKTSAGWGNDLTSSTITNEPFMLGAREGATFALFSGQLDEIGIWNRTITSQEVANLYNEGNGIVCPTQTTPTPTLAPTATPTLAPTATPTPTPTPVANACPTPALASFWKMDETGGSILDSKGGLNGSSKNLTVGSGKKGNARVFNGSTSYADFGNIYNFERTDSFTISTWVNQTAGTPSKFIIARQDNYVNGAGYKLATNSSGSPIFTFGPNQDVAISVEASQDIRGAWHLVTLTYDGTSKGSGLKMYIDGVLKATGSGPDLTASTKTSEAFRFGAREGATFALFQGLLDETGVWTRTLSPTEISNLYNQGLGAICP